MRIPGAGKAIANLTKWSTNQEWAPIREQVFADHFDEILEQFDTTPEEVIGLLGPAFDMLYGCVLEDFFTARFGDQGEKNIIDDYLKRRGWREKVPGRRYLAALKDSVLSLYEVIDLDPGHTMTVRDLVLGGDPITLLEKLGSESAARWDRIAGRIVTVNEKVYFTGPILLFPHEIADEVLADIDVMARKITKELKREAKKQGEPADFTDKDLREMLLLTNTRLLTQSWLTDALVRAFNPVPTILNSDGDEIEISESRFPVTGEIAEVIAGLDEIDEVERDEPDALRWIWRGPPPKPPAREKALALETRDEAGQTILGHIEIADGALVLSTNSRKRADRGRDLLLSHLGGLVGQPLTSHQTLGNMLDETSDSAPVQSEPPPEGAEQAIRSFMDSHYRQTLDDPMPYFEDKTPRQAARTKKGRARVINWLKQLENSEIRQAAREGREPYDFQWMWRELGVDVPD